MTTQNNKSSWFSTSILKWYALHGRQHLPWKQSINAYRVWISEIMLQQTQVSTVIPYFARFMQAFPTIEHLAKAPLDEVLHHWSGLGYYARGRNLHKTAQILNQEFHGEFPQTVEALITLPGIGRSTAGAIIAQSFNLRAPILDGNVKRVLCRFHCVPGWPSQSETEQYLWQLAEHYTPHKNVADYTQALMDLGATICTRTQPTCKSCPLQRRCQAFATKQQLNYPHKKPRKVLPLRQIVMLYLKNQHSEILLEQRAMKGIWGGLWSLPEFQEENAISEFLHHVFAVKRFTLQCLPEIKHTFTHFQLHIIPFKVLLKQNKLSPPPTSYRWHNLAKHNKLGLPAPISKILEANT